MSGQSLAPGEQPPSLESVIWNNSSQTLPTSKCWLSEGNIYVCFRCPCCHFPNNVDRNAIHSRTGVISVCEACGEISHLSASCQSTWSLLPRRVTGGILILRTGIEEWIRAHPNFYTLNKKDELNLLYYYYGLWFHCPQCHSKLGLYYSNASNYCCPQCGHDSDFLGIRLPLSRRMYRYLRS